MTHLPDPSLLDEQPELRWLAHKPPTVVLVVGVPLVMGVAACASVIALAGAAWEAVKRHVVPDEAFVGNWTNEDIDAGLDRSGRFLRDHVPAGRNTP